MFNIFKHSKPIVLAAHLVGLVDSQVSPSGIIMTVSKDFVTRGKRNNELAKEMTSLSFTRIPEMAENSVVSEVEISNMKEQGSGYTTVM